MKHLDLRADMAMDLFDIADHFSGIADVLEDGGEYTWEAEDDDTTVRMRAVAARSELLDAFDRLAEIGKGAALQERVVWLMSLHSAKMAVVPYLDFAIEQPAAARQALPSFGRHVRPLAEVLYMALMDSARGPAPPGHN